MSNVKVMKKQKTHGKRGLGFRRLCSRLLHFTDMSRQTTSALPLFHKTPSLPTWKKVPCSFLWIVCMLRRLEPSARSGSTVSMVAAEAAASRSITSPSAFLRKTCAFERWRNRKKVSRLSAPVPDLSPCRHQNASPSSRLSGRADMHRSDTHGRPSGNVILHEHVFLLEYSTKSH